MKELTMHDLTLTDQIIGVENGGTDKIPLDIIHGHNPRKNLVIGQNPPMAYAYV